MSVSISCTSCPTCICRRTTRSTSRSGWTSRTNITIPKRGYALYQRYLAELVLADKVGFDADRRQRASQHRYSMMAAPNLIAAAIIPQTKNAQDLRVGHAAEPGISEPPRRRIRHARRDVGGPAGSRVPARHRHGILGQPDQPGDGARAAQGIDRHHPAGLDAGRPDHILRRVLYLSLPQSVAAAVCRSRIRPATSSAPAVRRRSNSPPSSASATRRCS